MTMPIFATLSNPLGSRSKRWATACFTLAGVAVLTACASIGPAAPQEQVKQRATERWQALVKGDFDKAYSYNTPGFRALVTSAVYRSRNGSSVKWLGAEVVNVECSDAAKCSLRIKLDYKPILGGNSGDRYSTYLDESWLQEGGHWWIFQSISN